MMTFYIVAITALCAGTLSYLLGASLEWSKHLVTINEYQELITYSNAVTTELSDLRAAGDENAVGSRHPSLVRRSHLSLVK